jgi:hypothetical protein
MKPKEIHVSTKFVKNLGNYQSFTAEAGITVEIEPEDDVAEVYAKAWETVKSEVSAQIKGLKNN